MWLSHKTAKTLLMIPNTCVRSSWEKGGISLYNISFFSGLLASFPFWNILQMDVIFLKSRGHKLTVESCCTSLVRVDAFWRFLKNIIQSFWESSRLSRASKYLTIFSLPLQCLSVCLSYLNICLAIDSKSIKCDGVLVLHKFYNFFTMWLLWTKIVSFLHLHFCLGWKRYSSGADSFLSLRFCADIWLRFTEWLFILCFARIFLERSFQLPGILFSLYMLDIVSRSHAITLPFEPLIFSMVVLISLCSEVCYPIRIWGGLFNHQSCHIVTIESVWLQIGPSLYLH